MPNTALKSKIDTELVLDTLFLLKGARSGHMGKYAYFSPRFDGDQSSGISAWNEVVKNPDFPANREMDLLRHEGFYDTVLKNPLAGHNCVSFVEFGCGTAPAVRMKTKPLIDTFRSARDIDCIDYTAVDIVPELASSCALAIKNDLGIPTRALPRDFIGNNDRIITDRFPPIGVLFGGTLWNIPAQSGMDFNLQIANQINKIGTMLGVGSYLLTTHYWADRSNPDKILEPYKTDANKAMIGSILHSIHDVLGDSFDIDSFDIDVRYDHETRTVKMGIVSKIDQTIRNIPPYGDSDVELKEGHFLCLVNSVKLAPHDMDILARKADYRLITEHTDPNHNQRIVLMQYRGPAI